MPDNDPYSNHHLNNRLDSSQCRCHLVNGVFKDRINFDHFNTGQVSYSDPHCIKYSSPCPGTIKIFGIHWTIFFCKTLFFYLPWNENIQCPKSGFIWIPQIWIHLNSPKLDVWIPSLKNRLFARYSDDPLKAKHIIVWYSDDMNVFWPSYLITLSPAGLPIEGHCLPCRLDVCAGLWSPLWTVMGLTA